ncbi:hypothetical protein LTR94_025705, partial [Friedmanniomyces endolithicus]
TTTGAYVGSVGAFNYKRDLSPAFDAPEMGWGLSPAYQGKGLALEALEGALEWVDRSLGAPHTLCMIAPDNVVSIKLAMRAGFTPYASAVYKEQPVQLYRRQKKP